MLLLILAASTTIACKAVDEAENRSSKAAIPTSECAFSRDCKVLPRCKGIQDASCVCNFGKCVISGTYGRRRNNQCSTYEDCACKSDPARCFCRSGSCVTEAWECHQSTDCTGMAKCRGKQCNCQDNLCSWDCSATADCRDFHCNQAHGYSCDCQESLCKYVRKAEECTGIQECITAGKCTAAAPCSCTSGYCTDPWWVTEEGNCRNHEDCEASIAACRGGRCQCENMVARSQWEQIGTCSLQGGE